MVCGVNSGGIKFEIRKPAKMLPSASRLIGFSRVGLFSLIRTRVGNRGWPSRAKKISRVLYMAVKEVAIRVIKRAQAFE